MDDAAYEALMARLNEAYPSQPAYTSPDVKLQSGQITQQQGQDPVILTNPRTLQQGESNPIEFDQSGGVSQLGAMMNAGRLRGMLDMSGQDGMTPGYNAMLTAGGPDGFSTSYRRSNEIGGRGDAQNAIMIAKQFGERNAPSPSLSAGANWSGTGGPITYDLSGSVPLTTGRNPEAPQFRLPSSREEQPMVPLTRRDRERQPSRQEVKGAISAGLSHSPRDHSTRANAGLKFNYADGGHVDAALHLLRQHFDEGGFLSSLSNLFSGPDYLSNGKEASFANMPTQDETNADFFKADRALRLAQQASEPARDMPLPLRRPAPEAAPRQQVAAPAPAPAPAPVQAFRPVTTLPIRDVDEPHDFPPVTTPSLAFGEPVYGGKTQRLGGDEGQNRAPAVQMDYTLGHGQNLWPSSGNFKTLAGTVPENFNSRFGNLMSVDDARQSMMFRPEPRAEISRAVSLAQNLAPQQEAIPSAADALAAVKNLHNAGVYSGEALDKAGEILAAHNRAMFDNIPVEEALRLIRAEGPRMVNQGMPREERPAVQPLAYTAAPTPAPAAQAITEAMPATGKLTARIPDEPHGTALTKQQADYVIRTIAAETSGKSPEETQAIASVILNRINSGRYGATPEAVLFAKRQFEPWMNPAGKNYPMKISPTSQRYSDARDALEAAMAGEDITRGAINFWGPKSQYSLGRDTPDWALKMPDYTDIGATRFHRPNSPIQMAQAQAQEVPSTGLFAFGTNDPNPQTALKSAQQIYENARRAGIDPVFVLPNSADPRFAPISEALKKYADERGIKYETPGYDPKDPLHITPDTAKEIAKKYPGALVGGDSNSWRLQKYGYGRPVSSPNAFVDKGTGVKLGQVGAGSPDVAKWFGQYVDRLSRGRAHGGIVDDALHVVREHHADGEAVGQGPEMPAEEPRPLTIYRGNAPVADEAGGSGREAVPAFSYMPMPESVERQAARQPAYNPAERTWSDAGSTEGERLTRALGVEGELPKGETFMSPQPTGWEKYMPQRVPGTFLKRTGEAFNENADAVSEGLKAVREGNYGAGALGMVGGALGAAISPLTGMERVLVRDPYLRMTGNLKDAQAAEMAADVALTGGMRGPAKQLLGRGVEGMATDPWAKMRLPSPAAAGAATAAGAMLAPEDAEASKLSKAMEVARMAIPRELSPLGFYSHGAEAARGLAQAKGTPEQFAAMLQKSGVKGPEMEGFLKTFGGRPIVTQEEAAQYFKGAMPQVEETVLGGKREPVLNEAQKEDWINGYAAKRAQEAGDIENVQDWSRASPEVRDWHREEVTKSFNEQMMDPGFAEGFQTYPGTPTKFSQYTLPGGENYREVLLKEPIPTKKIETEGWTAVKDPDGYARDYLIYDKDGKLVAERAADSPEQAIQSATKDLNTGKEITSEPPKFQSRHWDDPNVLAHLRMSDRTGPNGEKILHVEEIQSDWGQKGKKEGFDVGITPQQEKRMQDLTARVADLSTAERGELGDLLRASGKGGVPSAPYVTNTQAWTDLALKRALKEAAEGGYDKLVWTPGAEQAKRYSLSNQVRSIDYMKEGDNSYRLGIVDKRGEGIDLPKETFTAKELEDYLGRDVANKIINDEGQSYRGRNHKSLEGVDLVLGGEGMKGYYDKIVPKRLQEIIKRHDPSAKVGYTDVMLPPKAGVGHNNPPFKAPGITITPKMRESIMKGQTAFKDGGSVVDRALMLVSRQA